MAARAVVEINARAALHRRQVADADAGLRHAFGFLRLRRTGQKTEREQHSETNFGHELKHGWSPVPERLWSFLCRNTCRPTGTRRSRSRSASANGRRSFR